MAAGEYIDKYSSYGTVEGSTGDDTIVAKGTAVTIKAYRGNDVIYMNNGNLNYLGIGSAAFAGAETYCRSAIPQFPA